MKRLLSPSLAILALAGWIYYSEVYVYTQPVDHELHRQCPDPSGEYYDCDWWPRRK